jgi:hypothetical protein
MKTRILSSLLLLLLTACQAATPQPMTATSDTEFILSVGQTASITDANIAITFISVSSDERCPSEIECAASGPVTIHLSIQDQDGVVSQEILQTFTDYKGLAPTMEFEGMKSSVSVDNFQIRIIGVLPYPKDRSSSIKDSEYILTLKVTGN